MTNESGNNKKIFVIEVVEDEKSLRDVLHDKFIHEGFSVLEAKNGEEGLATAVREHPDIILLDIVMPKMDGLTMMKKLRETNEWGKHVPIILLTNLDSGDEKIMTAITNNEPAYYLLKSDLDLSQVVEKIKERLARQS